MADVTDSKSVGSDTVRVQVPPPAPKKPDFGRAFVFCADILLIIVYSHFVADNFFHIAVGNGTTHKGCVFEKNIVL